MTDFEKHSQKEFLALKVLTTVKLSEMVVTISKLSPGEKHKFLEFYSAVFKNIVRLKSQSSYIFKEYKVSKMSDNLE